jgi:hypothetical protein
MKATFIKNRLLPILAVLGLLAYQYYTQHQDAGSQTAGFQPRVEESAGTQTGVIEKAYADKRSKVWVEVPGRISRLLSDDNEGSRHQRFILELDSGHTVMVAHNIDLAKRIPVQKNDSIKLKGRYEWNERGGVIHWTHHDPQDRLAGGWIEFNGTVYE